MSECVLIVDDDPDIRTFLEVTLELAGYPVSVAVDGQDAVAKAIEVQPDLIIMDVMMPNVDGMEACRLLRADGRTSHIPVILLTARAQGTDKVEGLAAGADDYVTKPFDPDELVARVQSTLRRAKEIRTTSPLTGLPGNSRIEQEIARRVDASEEFDLLYADLNAFKAYNDHYGFLRGDRVIAVIARVLTEVASDLGDRTTFVGHVGGDDFVVVVEPGQSEQVAEAVCRRFDAAVPDLYDDEDRQRGHIEVTDRQGKLARYPLVSVSIGIATTRTGLFAHHTEPVEIATGMKSYAKRHCEGPSNWAADRRVTR